MSKPANPSKAELALQNKLWEAEVEILHSQAATLEAVGQRVVTAWATWCREDGLGHEQAEMDLGNAMDALFMLVGEA